MTKSHVFLFFSLSLISGIFASSFFYPRILEKFFLLIALVFVLILLFVFYKNKPVMLAGFCGLFFLIGFWLTEGRLEGLKNLDQDGKNFSGIVVVSKEPQIKDRLQNIILNPQDKNFQGQKILLTVSAFPEYAYRDKLKVDCTLKIPENKENTFDYRMYLAKDKIFYLCKSPKIEIVGKAKNNNFFSWVLSIKNKFKQNINELLPSPQSGLLSGLLLGGTESLPEKAKDDFSQTGMTHIVAVSGYNVTIVAEYLILLGIFLGLWRKQAFWFAILGIAIFVFMVGLPSSAVRAGVMGSVLLWGMKNGRLGNSQNAIVFAAAVMLLINPLLLRWDIGFQLSFLATLGIIYFYPVLENYLIKKQKVGGLREIIFLTLSAQIFVLPIILFNFEKLSLISPLANLLVLPIIPITMLLGFLATLCQFFLPFLAQILSWPVFILLKYEVGTISFLAGLKFSSLEIKNFSWIGVVIWYMILAFIIYKAKSQKRS
jgi:competence protein ComEC